MTGFDWSSVSVVVPTLREAGNLPVLIERLARVRQAEGLDLEVVIVDDDSQDGTVELIESLAMPWVRLLVRTNERDLSSAVLKGLNAAAHEVLVVMDADLSHPPERIPQLIASLQSGGDFVLGSRYVDGGASAEGWGLLRWLNSRAATWLARPFTRVSDPMSGFFALRAQTLNQAQDLDPIGYKIGLELIVKCRCADVREVPISFARRHWGESKLTLAERWRYLRHVRRLLAYQYPEWAFLLHSLGIAVSGAVVNLAVLTALVGAARVPPWAAAALAVGIALVSNSTLHWAYTSPIVAAVARLRQLRGWIAACLPGALVSYVTTLAVMGLAPTAWPIQLAALTGVVAGESVNYVRGRQFVAGGAGQRASANTVR